MTEGQTHAVLPVRRTTGEPAGSSTADLCIGELAAPVHRVDAAAPVRALDEVFRREPAQRWVVADGPRGPVLLTRSWYELTMTGPLGYGRTLLERRPLASVLPGPAPVFPADVPVSRVAEALLDRTAQEEPAEGVVVLRPDGCTGVAPVAAVYERLALLYAHQALHDPLTGLPNRLHLLERLRSQEPGAAPATLCYVDLDRFKDVNDHLGHGAGDQVLVAFAGRLRQVTRAEDLLVRLGGDEFAVLSDSITPGGHGTALAERIVLAAAAPFVVGVGGADHVVSLGASVGVAVTVCPASPDSVLVHADLALHRAKSLGRGRVASFSPDLLADVDGGDRTRARHHMERRLRHAVDRAVTAAADDPGRDDAGVALTLHYQPLVALPSGHVTGVEALARWHDEELGQVPPDVFIPLAERSGLIVDVGRWVLRTACAEASGWPTGPSGVPPTVAVNVSAVQLAESGFVTDVVAALADSGLGPERLCLEITETAAITDLTTTAGRLAELRDLGVRLALDDFGAGHSSLTLLRRLPVHVVKIDRSFVERISRDPADAVLVRLVIEAAHSLGRRVCAEGVETAEQARQVVALGCDSAQGWLFGRPQPPSVSLTSVVTGRASSPELLDDGAPGVAAPLPLGKDDELILVTTPGRVITYASATVTAMLGWRPQELTGRSVLDFLEPEDRDRAARGEIDERSRDEGSVLLRVAHRDGGHRWLRCTVRELGEEDGAVREVLVVARDVTEAQQAQQALAASEAMFRHAFEDSPIGMALTDLDGTFLRANRAYAALIGTTTDALRGRRVQDVTHPDDLAADATNSAQLVSGEAALHVVRKRYLRPDGSAVPARVHASVVLDGVDGPGMVFAHVLPD